MNLSCFHLIWILSLFLIICESSAFSVDKSSFQNSIMSPSNGKGVLNRVTPAGVALEIKDPVDPKALEQATAIIEELKAPNGKVDGKKLLEVAKRLGDVSADATTFKVSKEQYKESKASLHCSLQQPSKSAKNSAKRPSIPCQTKIARPWSTFMDESRPLQRCNARAFRIWKWISQEERLVTRSVPVELLAAMHLEGDTLFHLLSL